MNSKLQVAILGSTGYVGLELVKLLIDHSNVIIKFLGCENFALNDIRKFDKDIKNNLLPKLDYNNNFDPTNIDLVFLDPPYEKKLEFKAIKNLLKKKILKPKKIIVVEQYSKETQITYDELELLRIKELGITRFSFFKVK